MILLNGRLVPEGMDKEGPVAITSPQQLIEFINTVGFLPLFKNTLPGFSLEERTLNRCWWSGQAETDPWEWRAQLASGGRVAYAKLFAKKAGFVSREWFPLLASYRRDGYDFDSRYEDGLATRKAKKLFDILEEHGPTLSSALKSMGGFGKHGETGFATAITNLQMQTYVTICGFQRKHNKFGAAYGMGATLYSLSENIWGAEHLHKGYSTPTLQAKEQILEHLREHFPGFTDEEYLKEIK